MLVRSRGRRKIFDLRQRPTHDWLALMFTPEHERAVDFENYRFPTDRHAEESLSQARTWTEVQAKRLLRGFLISNGSLGYDSAIRGAMAKLTDEELSERIDRLEFVRRLFSLSPPWEGVTWILDLLPARPRKAIEVLEAYDEAHCQFLPDGRAHGLFDAMSVIRSRYFQSHNDRRTLSSLTPVEFELLVGCLYEQMGYSVEVTRASKDGGIDVIATKKEVGGRLTVLIQCKHQSKRVPVRVLRELTGLVLKQHANKGVLVSSSDFTRDAKAEAATTSSIELIGFSELNQLLNQHLGSNWAETMGFRIRQQRLDRA